MSRRVDRRRFLQALGAAAGASIAVPAWAQSAATSGSKAAAAAKLATPRGSEFVFARLRYESGDWNYNPKVAANVLNSVVEYTNIRVYSEEVVIGASSTELL